MAADFHGKKIRIAVMTSTIDGRKGMGTATVARKCVEALLAAPDEFELTFIHFDKTIDPIYEHGVREIVLPLFRLSILNRRFFRQTYYFLTTKDEFDIIHWMQPRLYPFFWLAPARHTVVTLYGAGGWGKEHPFTLMKFIFNWTLRLFNKNVAVAIGVSEFAKQDIVKHYKFDPARVEAVCNGVEPAFKPANSEKIAAVRKKYNLPDTFFLNVARLRVGKNAYRTIRAFVRFTEMIPESDIHFVNAGAPGDESPLVDALLQGSPLKKRVHLPGFIDDEDLPALYSASFALVFPLLNEGFGLPILEAMACGTPVVASDTALPEISHDDAVLVDSMSEESIAEGMRIIYTDDSLHARFIERGFETAKKYTWEQMGQRVLEIYKKLTV